jgi:glycosyltransferase involved in cell wall biosynthesis
VIGKNPPAGLEGEGVEVTGFVTDRVRYLTETGAFIVPLHSGGGMRVKILNVWSWGLPVVSTSIGAERIDVQHAKNLLLADTTDDFAQAVTRVLNDLNFAQQLGHNGRQTVVEKYDWRAVYPAWDEVYGGLNGLPHPSWIRRLPEIRFSWIPLALPPASATSQNGLPISRDHSPTPLIP